MERSDGRFLLIDIFVTSNTHIKLFDRTALSVGYQLSVKRCSLEPSP